MMIRSLFLKAGGVFAAAALVLSFSTTPAAAATLTITYPDGCSIGGTAANPIIQNCQTSTGPGAPSCSGISSSAPNNALPAGGGSVTVTVNGCSGGTGNLNYSWNVGGNGTSVTNTISLTTTFTVTVTDSASPPQSTSQSLTVTVANSSSSGLTNCTNQGLSVMGGSAISLPWGGQGSTYYSSTVGNFGDSAVWVFQMTPTGPTSGYGRFSVAEYGGNAYQREMSISTTPCDFNLSGPAVIRAGTTATVYFAAASPTTSYPWYMNPGTTYYLSIRNFSVVTGSASCGQANCQAVLTFIPAN